MNPIAIEPAYKKMTKKNNTGARKHRKSLTFPHTGIDFLTVGTSLSNRIIFDFLEFVLKSK